jgi:hypothetical protein
MVPADDLEAGKDGDDALVVFGEAGLVHQEDVDPGEAEEQVLHNGKVVVAPANQKMLNNFFVWILVFIINAKPDPDPDASA